MLPEEMSTELKFENYRVQIITCGDLEAHIELLGVAIEDPNYRDFLENAPPDIRENGIFVGRMENGLYVASLTDCPWYCGDSCGKSHSILLPEDGMEYLLESGLRFANEGSALVVVNGSEDTTAFEALLDYRRAMECTTVVDPRQTQHYRDYDCRVMMKKRKRCGLRNLARVSSHEPDKFTFLILLQYGTDEYWFEYNAMDEVILTLDDFDHSEGFDFQADIPYSACAVDCASSLVSEYIDEMLEERLGNDGQLACLRALDLEIPDDRLGKG